MPFEHVYIAYHLTKLLDFPFPPLHSETALSKINSPFPWVRGPPKMRSINFNNIYVFCSHKKTDIQTHTHTETSQ